MMLSVMIAARAGKDQTLACIESVFSTFQAHPDRVEFILIDDSSDPSHEIQPIFQGFRRSAKSRVRIFRSKRHKHYCAGLGFGLSQVQGDFVLFLSNDMMITPAYIDTLLKAALKDPRAGIVRGTSQYVDSHLEHQLCAPLPLRNYKDICAFSRFLAEYYGDFSVEDRLLCGDAMLIKRTVIEHIGVTDTRFVGYFGDVDFGLRAQRAGFKLVCAKGAWLYHSGAVSIQWETRQQTIQPGRGFDNRMQIVQAAYTEFRNKWDPALPEVYPLVINIDFHRLQTIPISFELYHALDESLPCDYEEL